MPNRAERIVAAMQGDQSTERAVETLVAASFLSERHKKTYLQTWRERRNWQESL